MNIKLVNIYISEELSREGTAFHGDLFIEGKSIGTVENAGRGGVTRYSSGSEEGRKLLKEAEEWCRGLPPVISKDIIVDDEPFSISMNLELFLNDCLAEHQRKLEKKRMRRKMEEDMRDGILFGAPDTAYQRIGFRAPIETLLSKPAGLQMLQALIHDKILPLLKEGEKILNTNFSAETAEKLGIPRDKIGDGTVEKEDKKRGRNLGVKPKEASRRSKATG